MIIIGDKMKRILKSRIFFFILGAIVFSSITTVALSVASKDVSYNGEKSNVQDAIDDLYEKVNNGKSNIYYLGTGTSFDIKTLVSDINYSELTSDNFIVETQSKALQRINGYSGGGSSDWIQGSGTINKNYDASTGILNAAYNMYAIGHITHSGSNYYTAQINWDIPVKAYLVIGEIEDKTN